MKPLLIVGALALIVVGAVLYIAMPQQPPALAPETAETAQEVPEIAAATSPADTWWDNLRALCGNAYVGAVTSDDPADADLVEQPLTMHVRRCDDQRLEVPFHIGENRSRTWVLTRTDSGIQLQHDHRHEDGSEDAVTLYGGHTVPSGTDTVPSGTDTAQHFPADEYSKQLFVDQGLEVSVTNVWTMELIPGDRFSYILRRPERHFQADFDLTQTVEPPPAPWGHE